MVQKGRVGHDVLIRKAVMGDVTERYCSKCGTTVPDEAQFCIECGSQVPAGRGARPRRSTERPTQVDERGAGRLALLETLRQATRGEYDVVSEAGRGGMASVFLAHDIALDRKVAIKVFTPDVLGLGETVRERFQREARTAASLSHPHIIPVYAVQQSDQILYFVMKFVEGRSLESVLKEEGSLPVPMVMTILTQVGSALDYAHRKGVIHRDIKPGNIMLDQEGYAIVTDFGIAKVAESEGLTLTGSTVGTPAYMSPEQCMGMGVSGASDQYAMGVVTYQMLTGSLPFEGESAMTVMYKHTHEPPRHIADLSDAVPRPLANAVMRMLAKKPDDRFPNMAALIEAFGALQEDEGEMRTQMISLARSKSDDQLGGTTGAAGAHHGTTEPDFAHDSLTAKLKSTPVTPIPEAKPRKKKTVVWLIPTAAAAAAFVWLVAPLAFNSLGTSAPATPDTIPATLSTQIDSVVETPSIAALTIDPLLATLRVGETLGMTATVLDTDGNTIDGSDLVWQSRDESIMTVGRDGMITALAPGTTTVVVGVTGHTSTVPVVVEALPPPRRRNTTVRPAGVANVTVSPSAPTLLPGASVTLDVTARDAAGRTLTGRTTQWRTSDANIVRVDDGRVTAVRSGSAVITVVVEDRAASVPVTVSEPTVSRLTVVPASAEIEIGAVVTLRAQTLDGSGNNIDRPPAWRSDNPSIATVSSTGTVTALGEGTTSIWAERDGQSIAVVVTVLATAPVTPPAPDPNADRAEIATVVAAYSDAIQAESLPAIRGIYPSIPRETSDRFQSFFEAVTDLSVTLAVTDIQLDGDLASVTVDGRYAFRMNGSGESTDFPLRIQLERSGATWRITDVQ